MKIVMASAEIIEDELSALSMEERIERCGRICYKSEDKITPNSAIKFCRSVIKGGHDSVMEMGSVTVACRYTPSSPSHLSKYITESVASNNHGKDYWAYYTGSIRAWREVWGILPSPFQNVLKLIYPLFFSDLLFSDLLFSVNGWRISEDFAAISSFPRESPLLFDHHRVAVKFIINRAVSHELVRHRPCAFLQESQRYCRYDKDKFGNEVTFIKPSAFWAEDDPEYMIWRRAMEETECLYMYLLRTSSPQAARTVLPNSCKTELIMYASLRQWNHIFARRTSSAAEPSMREVILPLLEEFRKQWPEHFKTLTVIR